MQSDTQELVAALFRRSDLAEVGTAALRRAYPEAPPAMLEAAAFHLFTDGAPAAAAWLAALERFLRDPAGGFDDGKTHHLLYHLYNWQQFQALLPAGREEVLELLGDAKQFLAEEDPQAVRRVLDSLEEMFRAGLRPPAIE